MKAVKMMLIAVGLLIGIYNSNAQDAKGMATHVYNFIKFIDWPAASQNGEFIVGVVGETPVYQELEKLFAGRKAYNQPIVLKKFADPASVSRCHVIFLPDNYCDKIDYIKNKSKLYNTLIVCERSGMIKKGAAISFITQDSKLRYEVCRTNITNNGLYVDNKLELLALNIN
jgi:hypothetical protein